MKSYLIVLLLMGCRMRRATPRLSRGRGWPHSKWGHGTPKQPELLLLRAMRPTAPFTKLFRLLQEKGANHGNNSVSLPRNRNFTDFFDSELKMSKNSPIQLITEMIMHAFNKRGFFTVPCRPGFFVRPYPVAVRR